MKKVAFILLNLLMAQTWAQDIRQSNLDCSITQRTGSTSSVQRYKGRLHLDLSGNHPLVVRIKPSLLSNISLAEYEVIGYALDINAESISFGFSNNSKGFLWRQGFAIRDRAVSLYYSREGANQPRLSSNITCALNEEVNLLRLERDIKDRYLEGSREARSRGISIVSVLPTEITPDQIQEELKKKAEERARAQPARPTTPRRR